MLPRISIVTPVLNRVDTLEKALLSVIEQCYPQLELIIIDGGSSDGTQEIIKKYSSYISYWHSKPDGNPSIAMNMGVSKASGDLVALLMADDWYEPNLLWQIASAYQANPHADIFSCGGRIVTEKGKVLQQYQTEKELSLTFYNVCFAVSAICCRFIRKSIYNRVGHYPVANGAGKNMLCNDKEFLLRVILFGVAEEFVPVIGHNYLASAASSTFGNHKKNIIAMIEDHRWIAKTYLVRKDLSWKKRWLLHYWWMDQTTRLMLYAALDANWREVWCYLNEGFKQYVVLWPFALVWNTVKITARQLFKSFRRVFFLLSLRGAKRRGNP